MHSQISKVATRRSCAGVFAVGLLVVAASSLAAQENQPKSVDSPQPARSDYRFEVASIRPTVRTSFEYGDPRLKPQYSPGLYREEAVTLGHLIGEAFGIKHGYQMEDQSWMDSAYFTLSATPPEGTLRADVPIMLQHLLEDRFKLKYHHQTRLVPGYELVSVRPMPALIQSPVSSSQRPTSKGPPIETGKDGMPHLSKSAGSTELWTGTDAGMKIEWRIRNETMEQIAGRLADKVSEPVINATGLKGEYDFTLLYSPELPGRIANGDEAPAPMEHALLRDALREQLGLELKPIKNVPVDVIVIDGANREPTEN